MELLSQVTTYLNANQPVLIAMAGLLAVIVQYGINHIKDLGKLTNYILALAALPGVATFVAAFGTSMHLSAYPWVAVVGQILYVAFEQIKLNAAKKAVASVSTAEDGSPVNF